MFNANQNPLALNLNLPGYILSRAQLAERRDFDAQNRKGSWLDDVGEIFFLDAERAFVVPAQELSYVATEQLRNLPWPRLTKLVQSEDAGVLCTVTGHINQSWLSTFSKIALPLNIETERHMVKAFAPGYEGPVVAYHGLRTNDGELSWRLFEHAQGHALCDIDFVAYEGKACFAATTWATPSTPMSTVWVRECAIKALKDRQSVDATWTMAPWADSHNVSQLRGFLKDGQRYYSFFSVDQGNLLMAAPADKAAKVIRKNVKGLLNHVTGASTDRQNIATVITTDDKIIAIGKEETTLADLTQPTYQDLGRWVRQYKRPVGVIGKNGTLFMRAFNNPLCNVIVSKLQLQTR